MSDTATIQLDKERTLRFDFPAAVEFKKVSGISIMRGDLNEKTLDEESGVTLITACLRHEDPELTPDDVARALTIESFTEALEKITALMKAFQERAEKTGRPNPL